MPIYLSLKQVPDLSVEADTITPSHFVGKTVSEIEQLPTLQGNRSLMLKDFFAIKGDAGKTVDETEIIVSGDLRRIKMIGKGMNGGKITVDGNTGMYDCRQNSC